LQCPDQEVRSCMQSNELSFIFTLTHPTLSFWSF
jgi:hypothetical protein